MTFGQRLRHERERRKIPLESIAANTKIRASLFEELERDELKHWPAGVFRRAYIRAYADAIGIDPDATLREFLERFPDPAGEILPAPPGQTAAAPPAAPAVKPEARSALSLAGLRIRVLLADTRAAFASGLLLDRPRTRWAAIGCDVATVAAISILTFAVLGTFWMPLALFTILYYAAGILVLGNTPGVTLFALRPIEIGGSASSHATLMPRRAKRTGSVVAMARERASRLMRLKPGPSTARAARDILRSLLAARDVTASKKGS